MPDPLSKAKLDLDQLERFGRGKEIVVLYPETVLSLVARARRADELEKRVAELEARVEYLS